MTEVEALTHMLNDLDAHRLEVQLAPLSPRLRGYNEGGMKRVVVDAPPAWYRRLCAAHLSSRGTRRGKPDTKIKRRNVLALLSRLSQGKPTTSKYADQLRKIARGVK